MSELWSEWIREIPDSVVLLSYAYGLFVVTWPLFLWLERRSPVLAAPPNPSHRFNWEVVASNFVLTPLFYAAAIAGTATLARSLGLPAFAYPALGWSAGIPVVDVLLQATFFFLISCFLGDLWYYWWHRWQHTVPALWELHKLHHSDESLNATSIYRSHLLELPGQSLVRGTTVGLVVDVTAEPVSLIAILAAGLAPPVWDFFIHANVRFDGLHRLLPWLSTPQYHWIHHSKLPEHQDRNFAIWLPFFDVLFGSYYRPAVDEYPPTGLSTGEKIETLWDAQAGPFLAWARMLRGRRRGAQPS